MTMLPLAFFNQHARFIIRNKSNSMSYKCVIGTFKSLSSLDIWDEGANSKLNINDSVAPVALELQAIKVKSLKKVHFSK